MKNKGDVSVEPIVVLAVAISILSIVGFGFYLHYSGQIEFFKLLPGFNTAGVEKKYFEIISYDISSDKLEYYDGTNWIDFNNVVKEGKVTVGRKTLDVSKVRTAYDNHWFSKEARGDFDGVYDVSNELFNYLFPLGEYGSNNGNVRQIPPLKAMPFLFVKRDYDYAFASGLNAKYFYIIETSERGFLNLVTVSYGDLFRSIFYWGEGERTRLIYKTGSIIFFLISQGEKNLAGNTLYAEVVLKSDNSVEFRKINKELKSLGNTFIVPSAEEKNLFSEFVNAGIAWRDSVLAKSMALDGKYYCVKKIDSRLIVDLSLEVKRESKCNANI